MFLSPFQPEPVACPFCVEPDFGVLYEAPPPAHRRDNKGVAVMESSNISSTVSSFTVSLGVRIAQRILD